MAHAEAFARDLHAGAPLPAMWEALMELGATVCTPGQPRCDCCPLASGCTAHRLGTPRLFPLPRLVRAREERRWSVLWLRRDDGAVLLRRVAGSGPLGGLWLPPFANVVGDAEPAAAAAELLAALGVDADLEPRHSVRHSITHRRITVQPFVATLPLTGRVAEDVPGLRWSDPARLSLPTSSLMDKLHKVCAVPAPPGGSASTAGALRPVNR